MSVLAGPAPSVPEEHPSWWSRRRLIIASAIALAVVGAGVGAVIELRAPKDTVVAQPDIPRRDGDAIVVSARFRDQAGIATSPAVVAPLAPLVNAVGAVEFDPTHVAALGTRAAGVVTKVLHVEGDFVAKGDLLAEIESPGIAQAHADVPDGQRILRPGQSVNAVVESKGAARSALSVPETAITYVDGAATVFVATSPTRFEPRTVTLGIDGGDRIEVTKGVEAGELVVSKNVLAIKSELFR